MPSNRKTKEKQDMSSTQYDDAILDSNAIDH